jgi:hypothetical protein
LREKEFNLARNWIMIYLWEWDKVLLKLFAVAPALYFSLRFSVEAEKIANNEFCLRCSVDKLTFSSLIPNNFPQYHLGINGQIFGWMTRSLKRQR